MGSCYHIDIISSISDCKCCAIFQLILYHCNDLSLLLGAHSAGNDDLGIKCKLEKVFLHSLVLYDFDKRITSDNHSILADLTSELLDFMVFKYL